MVMMNDSEIETLKNELDYEKCCRDSASWLNSELESQIKSLQHELRQQEYSWSGDGDLEKENARHRMLLGAVEELKAQIPVLKERIRNAKTCGPDCKLKHDDLNINLDILTPSELVRTVKRFERLKTDLISTLRSKEWRLDSESKLFVRVNDQRTYLQNELMVCHTNLARLQRNNHYCQGRKEDREQSHCRRKVQLPPIAAK